MQIKYSPFIDKHVDLQTVSADLEGTITLHGTIAGKRATLTLTMDEAVTIFRDLKKMDVEALARIHAS